MFSGLIVLFSGCDSVNQKPTRIWEIRHPAAIPSPSPLDDDELDDPISASVEPEFHLRTIGDGEKLKPTKKVKASLR